jgi:hypothetical protein
VRSSYLKQVEDLPDHVLRACGLQGRHQGPALNARLIERPFSPDMSIDTVRALSGVWHEAVALSDPATNSPLPAPWRGPAKIGDINILPLNSAAEIAAEGRAMYHCVGSYVGKVLCGESYLYSARNGSRLATIEVRHRNGHVWIEQMRGPCNALVASELGAKLRRWVREKDKWTLPKPKERPTIMNGGLIGREDEEISF